ncbi:MAG TPA: SEC-C metal-binding domain-containing protein [Egibacteraceae bacterium]|nr:SEC-C metal-binding domain-containing protein [Egibacteraceae bacterium]
MTMICVSAAQDHAAIMSDTLLRQFDSRNAWVAEDERKVMVLPEINAAVTARGHAGMAQVWAVMAARRAGEVADFDEFTERAQTILLGVLTAARERPWYERLEGLGVEFAGDLCAYFVGWSPRAGRFKAFAACASENFKPDDISDEFHATPVPLGAQPTAVERRIYERMGNPLPSGPPVSAPTSVGEWVGLAKRIHRTRAVRRDLGLTQDMWKVEVGGPVHLTRLVEGGPATQQRIHTFDAEDFRAAFTGSFHPVGQLGPCPCRSGRRYLDCHIALWQDLPCHCESGDTLRNCCKLDLDSAEAVEWLSEYPDLARPVPPRQAKVGRNEPCPCGSGVKAKKCCLVGAAA